MLGQALDDVTALVDQAALDGGGHTEGVSDRFAECLRAIDDEQPRQCRIEPPGEEIVDQGLDENGGDKLVHGSGGISQPRAE